MKSIEKLPWLAVLEMQTEKHIHVAVKHFQNMDENILNQSATNGGWSIAQCLEHLNTYGRYYLPLLQRGITEFAASNPAGLYKSSILGAYLIRVTDPDTSSMKLKAVKRHQPAANLPAHQIVADFIEQQETMLDLIRRAAHIDVNRVKIPLSIASLIRIPLGDILHFMVIHTKRHLLQANRNILQATLVTQHKA